MPPTEYDLPKFKRYILKRTLMDLKKNLMHDRYLKEEGFMNIQIWIIITITNIFCLPEFDLKI